ncbi:unnamed protein product [Urochloa humidicola]
MWRWAGGTAVGARPGQVDGAGVQAEPGVGTAGGGSDLAAGGPGEALVPPVVRGKRLCRRLPFAATGKGGGARRGSPTSLLDCSGGFGSGSPLPPPGREELQRAAQSAATGKGG